jgi:hypothetical protein
MEKTMKYTLISKTGKPGDLLITLEEALPALRARYGDNGRAIIRELLDLVAANRRQFDEYEKGCVSWVWAINDLLTAESPKCWKGHPDRRTGGRWVEGVYTFDDGSTDP